ncbi:hypothetical protein [Streptomyces vinaceus]|uniref:hypothetical protein n=1 Tax=Streptomyces vinaceus TaxID=1960 RepID=UPI00381C9E44
MAESDEEEPLTESEERLVERAWGVLAAVLERDPEDLELETSLADDLAAGEEKLTNVAMALELELDLSGLFEEVGDWETVDDILDSVLYCADDEADDAAAV